MFVKNKGFYGFLTLKDFYFIVQTEIDFVFELDCVCWNCFLFHEDGVLYNCCFLFTYNCVDGLPLQWKLCKIFHSKGSKVLDAQFGVIRTSLKMVSS